MPIKQIKGIQNESAKKKGKFCPKCKTHKVMTVTLNKQQGKNKVHPYVKRLKNQNEEEDWTGASETGEAFQEAQ